MSEIRQGLSQIEEPEKSVGEILIEFYETMRGLEKDSARGGKQATKIAMTINDLNALFEKMYPVPEVGKVIPIVTNTHANMAIACEFGFRSGEKGNNLEKTMSDFNKHFNQ